MKIRQREYPTRCSTVSKNFWALISRMNHCLMLLFDTPRAEPVEIILVGDFQTRNCLRIRYLAQTYGTDATALMCLRYAHLCKFYGGESGMCVSGLDALYDVGHVTYEGFSSPLNCRLLGRDGVKFCSLFNDTDAAFGSLGNFFRLDLSGYPGGWSLGPPFVEPVLNATAERKLWNDAEPGKFWFFVTFPHWDDNPGWQRLDESPQKVARIDFNQQEFLQQDNYGIIYRPLARICIFILGQLPDDVDLIELRNGISQVNEARVRDDWLEACMVQHIDSVTTISTKHIDSRMKATAITTRATRFCLAVGRSSDSGSTLLKLPQREELSNPASHSSGSALFVSNMAMQFIRQALVGLRGGPAEVSSDSDDGSEDEILEEESMDEDVTEEQGDDAEMQWRGVTEETDTRESADVEFFGVEGLNHEVHVPADVENGVGSFFSMFVTDDLLEINDSGGGTGLKFWYSFSMPKYVLRQIPRASLAMRLTRRLKSAISRFSITMFTSPMKRNSIRFSNTPIPCVWADFPIVIFVNVFPNSSFSKFVNSMLNGRVIAATVASQLYQGLLYVACLPRACERSLSISGPSLMSRLMLAGISSNCLASRPRLMDYRKYYSIIGTLFADCIVCASVYEPSLIRIVKIIQLRLQLPNVAPYIFRFRTPVYASAQTLQAGFFYLFIKVLHVANRLVDITKPLLKLVGEILQLTCPQQPQPLRPREQPCQSVTSRRSSGTHDASRSVATDLRFPGPSLCFLCARLQTVAQAERDVEGFVKPLLEYIVALLTRAAESQDFNDYHYDNLRVSEITEFSKQKASAAESPCSESGGRSHAGDEHPSHVLQLVRQNGESQQVAGVQVEQHGLAVCDAAIYALNQTPDGLLGAVERAAGRGHRNLFAVRWLGEAGLLPVAAPPRIESQCSVRIVRMHFCVNFAIFKFVSNRERLIVSVFQSQLSAFSAAFLVQIFCIRCSRERRNSFTGLSKLRCFCRSASAQARRLLAASIDVIDVVHVWRVECGVGADKAHRTGAGGFAGARSQQALRRVLPPRESTACAAGLQASLGGLDELGRLQVCRTSVIATARWQAKHASGVQSTVAAALVLRQVAAHPSAARLQACAAQLGQAQVRLQAAHPHFLQLFNFGPLSVLLQSVSHLSESLSNLIDSSFRPVQANSGRVAQGVLVQQA
uniref:PCIF1_WW domain-containing protein n=1 Tax=Macrostomum lignano TaxID=282301 RepID=A0A1I8J898_9PLAT